MSTSTASAPTIDVWEALTASGPAAGGVLHCWDGSGFDTAPFADVVSDGMDATFGLRRLGVRPGSRVAAVLTNTPATIRGLIGTWMAGGAIASLPIPARGMSLDAYAAQLEALCEHVGAELLMVDAAMLPVVPASLRERLTVSDWTSVAGSGQVEAEPPGLDELAYIQYSSGSTGTPKGCMLTPRAIGAQLELLRDLLEAEPGRDRVCSWMPLSHDMGVFGNLMTPWALGLDLVLSAPERFLMSPRTWWSDVSEFEATITTGTSTALHIGSRVWTRDRLPKALKVHTCIIGAEPIDAAVFRSTCERLAPYGFTPDALVPAYGMAEGTLAITALGRGRAPSTISVDPAALAEGTVVEREGDGSMEIVGCGPPCTGVELENLRPGEVSELHVRTKSLSIGYYGDPERTAERFVDGVVRTGDLAFEHEGQLYLVGRNDDLIQIAGRNLLARDVELAVEGVEGIRRGCVTLVDVPAAGRSQLVLLAEVKDGTTDLEELADEAAAVAMSSAAADVSRCVFLAKGRLPKTPSGKHQRHRCRALVAEGAPDELAMIDLTGGRR